MKSTNTGKAYSFKLLSDGQQQVSFYVLKLCHISLSEALVIQKKHGKHQWELENQLYIIAIFADTNYFNKCCTICSIKFKKIYMKECTEQLLLSNIIRFHLYCSNIFVGILCKGFNCKRSINAPYENFSLFHYFPDVLEINIYAEGIFEVSFCLIELQRYLKLASRIPRSWSRHI